MIEIGTSLVLVFTLVPTGSVAVPLPPSTLGFAATESPPRNSSSSWLRTGEAHEQRGEYAEAGDAYRHALAGLSDRKQRANEGARAAILSAEAHGRAFDHDAEVTHLDAALDVLEHWLALTGPQSHATMLPDVQRLVARLRAVRDPLVEADSALADGEVEGAAAHYREVLDALASQSRAWASGAGVALRGAEGLVAVYDAHVQTTADIEPHLRELELARDLLTTWQERPAEAPSDLGVTLDRRRIEIEAKIEAAGQALAEEARAEQRRAAEARAAEEARAAAAVSETAAPVEPPPSRTVPIVLLSIGVVATAAGAGLMGEGIVFDGVSRDLATSRATAADMLAQTHGDTFDRVAFDTELRAYQAEADRRDRGLLIGGSLLAAGGITMSVVGIVMLARGRRSTSVVQRGGARLSPQVSPTAVRLSFTTRF